MTKEPHILDGKTIAAINITADKEAIQFVLDDGNSIEATCYSECCSHTWIEAVELPALGFPAKVLKADNLDMNKEELREDYECIRFYGFKIETDKGDIVIDYRNSSNGYYGGDLEWPAPDNSYFYRIARKTEDWKPISEVF